MLQLDRAPSRRTPSSFVSSLVIHAVAVVALWNLPGGRDLSTPMERARTEALEAAPVRLVSPPPAWRSPDAPRLPRRPTAPRTPPPPRQGFATPSVQRTRTPQPQVTRLEAPAVEVAVESRAPEIAWESKPVELAAPRIREAFPGKKAFLAHNADEFAQYSGLLAKADIRASVLDFIPGPDSVFFNYSVYRTTKGEFLGGFAMRKMRKTPPFFGVCRVAHANVSPKHAEAMRESVEAMLSAIDYRGMANAEFKLDQRDSRLRLMEINARPFLMQGLPLRAGIAYARMAWQDVVLDEHPTFEDNGWRGAWIHLHADIGNALAFHRQEALPLAEYLRPYHMPHTWAVWSAADPKPFLLQWSRTMLLRPFER